jgi:hypothetical protein
MKGLQLDFTAIAVVITATAVTTKRGYLLLQRCSTLASNPSNIFGGILKLQVDEGENFY